MSAQCPCYLLFWKFEVGKRFVQCLVAMEAVNLLKWSQHSLSSPSSVCSFTAKPGKIKFPFLSLPYSCFCMQISFYQLDVLSWDLQGRHDLKVIFLRMLWLLLPESSLKDFAFFCISIPMFFLLAGIQKQLYL